MIISINCVCTCVCVCSEWVGGIYRNPEWINTDKQAFE